jgi:hypothetical protein
MVPSGLNRGAGLSTCVPSFGFCINHGDQSTAWTEPNTSAPFPRLGVWERSQNKMSAKTLEDCVQEYAAGAGVSARTLTESQSLANPYVCSPPLADDAR